MVNQHPFFPERDEKMGGSCRQGSDWMSDRVCGRPAGKGVGPYGDGLAQLKATASLHRASASPDMCCLMACLSRRAQGQDTVWLSE